MTHKTEAIILKSVKYGETSLIVTAFTEKFGIQTYIINGIRTSKKGSSKYALFQPTAILDLDVYNNDLKSIQKINESGWNVLYNNIFSSVIKNGIALFMVELITKSLKQPEQNPDLFYFLKDALVQLDNAPPSIASNIPLYFALHLSYFFGFRLSNPATKVESFYLDLLEGSFVEQLPSHKHFLSQEDSQITAELLKVMQLSELEQFKLNGKKRSALLQKYVEYYSIHIQGLGEIKTLQVLSQLIS